MISVQHKLTVGQPFQSCLNPGRAIAMQVDSRAFQIIPPLQLSQEFFPQFVRGFPVLADMEYIFADAAFPLLFNPFVPADQRGDGTPAGLQLHMVFICIHMEYQNPSARDDLLTGTALPYLVQNGLPADRPSRHCQAASGVGLLSRCLYQRQTDAPTDPLIGCDACYLIHGMTVGPVFPLVIGSMVCYTSQSSQHLPWIALPFHHKAGFSPSGSILQEGRVDLLIVGGQKLCDNLADPGDEVFFCLFDACFRLGEEIFDFPLEFCHNLIYHCLHRDPLSFCGLGLLQLPFNHFEGCPCSFFYFPPTFILHRVRGGVRGE